MKTSHRAVILVILVVILLSGMCLIALETPASGLPSTPGDPVAATEAAPVPERILVGTFNIRSFSSGSRDKDELALIADRIRNADLWALQELRDEEALVRLASVLNKGQEGPWAWMVSQPVGRGSTELYAFLYRSDLIRPLSPLRTFHDKDDLFIREPVWARFGMGGFSFGIASFHGIFGDTVGGRRKEVIALARVVEAMSSDPALEGEDDLMVAGDFNLSPTDSSFDHFREKGWQSLNPGEGTTIRESPYDTMWLSPSVLEYEGTWNMERFDETIFANDDEAASKSVSDHRPLWGSFAPQEAKIP